MNSKQKWPVRTGENNNKSKLTWEKVRAIRASEKPSDELAKEFAISIATIYKVKCGSAWRE